jgi:hypothetical protein
MIKKLAAAAALTAGLTLFAPSAAFASTDTGYVRRTVYPGQTSCLPSNGFAFQSARGELVVTSGHAVRVTFGTLQRPTIYDSLSPVFGAAPEITIYSNPNAFPGQFTLCAVNQSQKVSYVQLRVIAN